MPGVLSVAYNTERPAVDTKNGYKAIQNSAESLYGNIVKDATVTTVTDSEGTQETQIGLNSLFENKEVKLIIKAYDKYNDTDWANVYDFYDVYEYYLNTGSDKYFLKVVDNFIQDPKTGTAGVLVLLGDTANNKVTQYFLQNVTSEEALKVLGNAGKVVKTAGKVWGTVNDVEDLRAKILASDYPDSQKTALLKELETYQACNVAFQIGMLAVGFAIAGAAPEVYVFYLMVQYCGDEIFSEWKEMLESGVCAFRWVVDPSGFVYEAVESNRLEGVKVTVYYKDDSGGETFWDAENYSQENPLYTDSDGVYAWDVPEGRWRVKYELEGYETAYSDWYDVPPAQTDINIGLVAEAGPELVSMATYDTYAELLFSQYMNVEAVSSIVLTDENGKKISYEIQSKAQTGIDGAAYAKHYRLIYDQYELKTGTDGTVQIPAITSYNGKKTQAEILPFTGHGVPVADLPEQGSMRTGDSVKIKGTILNYSGQETITAETGAAGIVSIKEIRQPDKDGNFVIIAEGVSSSQTDVTVRINETGEAYRVTLTSGETGDLEVVNPDEPEEPPTEEPETEPATEEPETEPSTETPETEPSTETPSTEPSTETPSTEPSTETPETEPSTETPSTEPSTETPASTEKPASQTPEKPETPVPDSPEGSASDPASVAGVEKAITAMSDTAEPAGSSFAKIQVKSTKQTNKSITVSWNKVPKATGYIVYGNQCGKGKPFQRLAKLKKTSFKYSGLKKGTYYKFSVVAYRTVNGKESIIAKAKTIHVVTKGGKTTNIKKVKLNKTKVTLKKKKTFKLTVKTTLQSTKLKQKQHRKVMFESSNPKIATVDKKGKIKAKAKGTCYIYAYAQNGVYARIKVTVKG